MTESFPIEIKVTPDFRKQLRKLEKRYRKIKLDLEPIIAIDPRQEFGALSCRSITGGIYMMVLGVALNHRNSHNRDLGLI